MENSKKGDFAYHDLFKVQKKRTLKLFDQILFSSKEKQIVFFLDYDGILSPIVADPDKAFITRKMSGTLRDIAKYFPTAIVTGRCRDK
ncbi:hypothetical protein RYX36_022528, partial [Vicia faba]